WSTTDTTSALAPLVRRVRAWRFWTTERGVSMAAVVYTVPYLVPGVVLVLRSPMALALCAGCVLSFTERLVVGVCAVICIAVLLITLARVWSIPDPFGVRLESLIAVSAGGVPATIAFLVQALVDSPDGQQFQVNMVAQIGCLVFALTQTL